MALKLLRKTYKPKSDLTKLIASSWNGMKKIEVLFEIENFIVYLEIFLEQCYKSKMIDISM